MRERDRERIQGLAIVAAGLVLGACSNMPGLSDIKLPSASAFIPTNANAFNQAAVNSNRPVTAADFVDGQGACPGAADAGASGADGAQPAGRGVALDMTECQVVQTLGAPQSVDIATNEQGERAVTIAFVGGERAGLYRFVRGRLVSIERAPGAEPQRPAKPAPKNQPKKPPPA